jgi:hypothetical protein
MVNNGLRADVIIRLSASFPVSRPLSRIVRVVAGTLIMLTLMLPARARDDGRYQNVDPTIKAWVKSLTDRQGNNCCDTADGYPAEVEWDNDTGRYRVRIDGAWYDVPDEAVITQPNRLGYAVVWYHPRYERDGRKVPVIQCFLPGAGG